MIDSHQTPPNWGICPVLFRIGALEITSYSFFVLLGLIVGLIVYFKLSKKMRQSGENSFFILVAGLVGGILGAKLPYWIFNIREIIASYPDIMPILSGRTITGGLICGTLSVIYIKRKLKITDKKGNIFAPAIALGVAIGRIGCLLQGCCYGEHTELCCGMNFGDGILRHPTQIYEIIFFLIFFVYSLKKIKVSAPGYLFYLLMNCYFAFRFFEEFIRFNDAFFLGLSFFQYISIIALIFVNCKHYFEKRAVKNGRNAANKEQR